MSFARLRFWIVFGIIALLAVAAVTFGGSDAYWRLRGYRLPGAHEALTIGTTTVQVVHVLQEKDRQRGLSGTDGLAPDG
jgi:hypothetical protein